MKLPRPCSSMLSFGLSAVPGWAQLVSPVPPVGAVTIPAGEEQATVVGHLHHFPGV